MPQVSEQIVNPRTGQTMLFRHTVTDAGGSVLQIEAVNPKGSGDPEHVHPKQVSSAEVRFGTLHFRIDGREQVVRAGEKIVIPANTPHNFWNEDEEDAVSIQEFRPALHIEDFFRAYFTLAQDGKLNENGMPPLLQMALLVTEFRDEIRPVSPPWPLLRAISAVLAPVARVRGYRRFDQQVVH